MSPPLTPTEHPNFPLQWEIASDIVANYMLPGDAIVAYTFDAEIVHPRCLGFVHGQPADDDTMSTEDKLDQAASAVGIDRHDERSFDSGEFPKVVFASQVESHEERCDRCHEPIVGD